MKSLHQTLGLIALGVFIPLAASGQATTTETTEVEISPAGATTETTVTETRFTPEIRTQVTEYFQEVELETPEQVAAAIGVAPPLTTETLARGYVIAEEQRAALRPAPDDLIRMLPLLRGPDQRYFILGSHVVALNTESYTVLDALEVPALASTAGPGAAATAMIFTPVIETRVTEYFGGGTPPAISQRVTGEIPAPWLTTRIAPGYTIAEEHRTHLVSAPDDLIDLLPALPDNDHQYYVMGGNLVAVNTKTHTVLDSIRIPLD